MQRSTARTFSPLFRRTGRQAGVMLAGALLAASALSGCAKVTGFDVETDKQYVPGHGANYRVADVDAPIDLVGMVIVSGRDGAGTLITTFANNDPETATTPEITSESVTIEGYTPFELEPNGWANLASDDWIAGNEPILLEGDDITAGASIPFTVGTGDLAELVWVPVVPNTPTTTTLAREDEHGEGHGEEGEDHGDDHGEDHGDESPNPWAGLDQTPAAGAQAPETMDPTAAEAEG